MARWLTTTQFCAIYQIGEGKLSTLLKRDVLVYIKGSSSNSSYRILDPGQEFMAVYKRDVRYLPIIRGKEAAAMLGKSQSQIRNAVYRGEVKSRTKEHPHYSMAEVEAMYRTFHGEKTFRPEIVRWGIDLLTEQIGHTIEVSEEIEEAIKPKPVKTDRLERHYGVGYEKNKDWPCSHNPLWCRGNYGGEEPIDTCWPCIQWAFEALINKSKVKVLSP